MATEEKVYCICRTGETKDRFMIACDRCEDWFHGDCVQVTTHTAKSIKKFYCPPCRETDPSLEIQRHHHHKKKEGSKKTKTSEGKQTSGKRGRPLGSTNRVKCGRCIGCFRTEDCGKCESCLSPGLPCKLRQCVNAGVLAEAKKKKDHPRAKMKNVSRKKGEGGSGGGGGRGTRQNTRAYQDFMKEAGLISSEEEEEDHRQCMGIQCIKPARKASKYCSDECGLQMAKVRLCQILPGRLDEWEGSPSAAEEQQKTQLEVVRQRREIARQKLTELDGADKRLQAWLTKARTVPATHTHSTEDSDGEDQNIFCSTCGMEIPSRTAMKHMVKCFSKYESQASYGSAFKTNNNLYDLFCDTYNKSNGTYCKRLRVICPEHSKDTKAEEWDVCGYPTGMDGEIPVSSFRGDMMCRAEKRKCTRHYQWEKLRKALIDTDRLAQLFKLDELFEEERGLRYALASRGGVLALLLHRTYAASSS